MSTSSVPADMNAAREKLLAALLTAQQWITNEKVPHPRLIPQSLQNILNENIRDYNAQHKDDNYDWLYAWNELLRNPPVDISPTAKPKVLRGFFEKLYAYNAFMKSDATNLYVFSGEENDVETEDALGEAAAGWANCLDKGSIILHTRGQTFVKGPAKPEKPAKNIYFLMKGDEALATDPNGKRMYVGRDTFREKYQHVNFKQIVHRTMAEKVAVYEAFFTSNDRVLKVMGGDINCPALAQINKRPAVWIPSDGPYSPPMKLPAIGYAEGEEEPPAKAIFYLSEDDVSIQDYISENSYTSRGVHFASEAAAVA